MMKRNTILSIFLLSFACTACSEKEEGPSFKGEVTISSELFGTTAYYVNGFSFEEDKFVPTLNSGGSIPDIIPENILKVNGDVIGMVLSVHGVNSYGFYKNFESNNLAEAQEFYKNYLNADAGTFSPLTDTIRTGQVYTFRTHKSNYVKFLVKAVRLKTDSPLKDYLEADIQYFIQRNGTLVFEE